MWDGDNGGCEGPRALTVGSRGSLATSQDGLSPSAGLKISPMVSVPCGCLLCFIPESPMSGVFALKVFCGAGAREACLVQGTPLLSSGKLLGGVHQVGMEKQLGNTQRVRSNTVCAFSPYKNMIFYGVLCLAAQRVFY